MASLAELRDALTTLGASTSTGSLRGEERRLALQQRLHDVHHKLGIESQVTPTQPTKHDGDLQALAPTESEFTSMSLAELRTELERRQMSTQTPGLKADARRHALIQRLLNSTSASETKQSSEMATSEDGSFQSSRSSSTSYSVAGEFLFFDTPTTSTRPNVPTLHLPVSPHKPKPSVTISNEPGSAIRAALEEELIRLRRQLHDQRSQRSQAITARLDEVGFSSDLETLASTMASLESERIRLLNVAFAHELVTTSAVRGQQLELVQEDAVRLIEARQRSLREQIQRIKDALAIAREAHSMNQDDHASDEDLEASIRRSQMQLTLYKDPSDAGSNRSFVKTGYSEPAAVLTRCRSVPAHAFHDTWRDLDASQKQQLHHELRAAKSFRIRRDRVCVAQAPSQPAMAVGRQSVLSFTAYPPTAADKLGIKVLFLQQSHRSPLEIHRVYQQALAMEPTHTVVLCNYATFLYQRCHQIHQADELFTRAIGVDPLSPHVLGTYARFLHYCRQDLSKAEEVYLKALQVTPQDPGLLGSYAALLRQRARGNPSQLLQAKRLLTQAIDAEPESVVHRLCLCSVLEDMGELATAQAHYEDLVKRTSLVVGNENQSDELTPRTALAMGPYAHVYGNFANFLKRRGEFSRARTMYETAIRLRPTDPLLQRNYSVLFRDLKVLRPTRQ